MLVLFLVLSSVGAAHAQTQVTPAVTVTEQIQPTYDVYGSGTNPITVVVSGSYSSLPSNGSFSVTSLFNPSVEETVNATQLGAVVYSSQEYTIRFNVTADASFFQVVLYGSSTGPTFLWRYIASTPYVRVTGVPAYPQYLVSLPTGNVISQVYAPQGATLPLSSVSETSSGAGQTVYNVSPLVGLMVFQSSSFLPVSIVITAVALAMVALAALNLFAAGRAVLNSTWARVGMLGAAIGKALPFRSRKGFRPRSVFQPRKLLALFILCSLLMVALGSFGGPDPRVKAYVIAGNAATTGEIQTQLEKVAGGNVLVITPTEDYSDFAVMSSVGQFNVIVFSNYTPAQIQEVAPFVLGSLSDVPVIVVDNTGNATINQTIETLYPSQVLVVQNAANLTSSEQQQLSALLAANQRTNVLGLTPSDGEFTALLATEGVLSMVLIFLGWAFLGSLTSESRGKTDLSHLVVLIGAGVFLFFFSEAIYILTSSALAVPLSLHAVNSDAHDLTAIGLLGFGGGSTPRLAAGFLGVLIGAVGVEGGLPVKKADFALIAGLALFLLLNPFFVGVYMYQLVLLFFPLGSLVFGTAYSNALLVKGFIYGFGTALGGGVTPTYILSAGNILFFAGLVPLAYIKKMGRTTTALALLVVALMIGDGGVRVGQMTPDQTTIAVLPGIVAGFAFAVVILGLAVVEKYVRGNWGSRA